MEISEVLPVMISIIGACAWLPEVIRLINSRRGKISASVLDVLSIKDYRMKVTDSQADSQIIKGLLIILMLKFHYSDTSRPVFSFWNCDIEIALKDDARPMRSIIVNNVRFRNTIDASNTTGSVPMRFVFPQEYNILLNSSIINESSSSTGIYVGERNVRIIPCFLLRNSDLHPITINDIKHIHITMYDAKKKHTRVPVILNKDQHPKPGYIKSYAKKV